MSNFMPLSGARPAIFAFEAPFRARGPHAVMTGLVPVISVGARSARRRFAAPVRPGPIARPAAANSLNIDVDGRDKPGDDGEGAVFDPRLWVVFSFFPFNPLKLHETTKEKLADSKEKFGYSKRILGEKSKSFGVVPAISTGRRPRRALRKMSDARRPEPAPTLAARGPNS